MMYKRRWFLRLEEFRLLIARSVATIAAMKSGLKVNAPINDESTESVGVPVATIAAMKSGLKGLLSYRLAVATIAAMKSGLKGKNN